MTKNSRSGILFYAGLLLIVTGCSDRNLKHTSDIRMEKFVDSVMQLMTLEEKLGQLTLYTSDWDVTGPVMREDYIDEIRAGRCGNVFNAHTVNYNRKLQQIAVEETRLGIPLLFGYDVLHGYKTIFPIPLAEACSWNLSLMERSARLAAEEASASGVSWTFAPMVDISRDPRWGRISEGNGEDTYLASRIAAVRVKGFQGDDLSANNTVASCVKHFAGYGAPVAGRDYNSVEIDELSFRQFYLPPYKAGIDAGAVTAMASFNDLFGIPVHASHYLLNDILRQEWKFTGFVVADYSGIDQLRNHGVAESGKHAGELAMNAGVDMDMQSAIYTDHLAESLKQGKVSAEAIDNAVRRVLTIKYRLGLFDDPYRYLDEEREAEILYKDEVMEHALRSARESMVLLKNEGDLLPLTDPQKIAVIGPMADNQLDMMGSWHAAGDRTRVVTVLEGLRKRYPQSIIRYTMGCGFYKGEKFGFADALHLAQQSDVVVLAIGEDQEHSGEAASRSDLHLTGMQEKLAMDLLKTGKPVIILIMAERPLTFPELNENASTIVYAWHLGTRGGDAIAEVLAGDYNPSGKLVMSIPYNTGQIPVYYNEKSTGRPFDSDYKYTSKYLDIGNEPMYPFGYGLSYTRFDYGNPVISDTLMKPFDTLTVTVKVENTGACDGDEIVQLYIRDRVGSITRPVKELKGFEKVSIKKGETREIAFSITSDMLEFVGTDMNYILEPGEFNVYTGPSSVELKETGFRLIMD